MVIRAKAILENILGPLQDKVSERTTRVLNHLNDDYAAILANQSATEEMKNLRRQVGDFVTKLGCLVEEPGLQQVNLEPGAGTTCQL